MPGVRLEGAAPGERAPAAVPAGAHDPSGGAAPGPGLSPRALAAAQGSFYVATGVWSIVSRRTFERVTGFKFEGWLLKTVGALVAVGGTAMVQAARHDRVTPEIELLAAGTAASLSALDLYYAGRRRIHPVYLLDGVVEAGLVAAWTRARRR